MTTTDPWHGETRVHYPAGDVTATRNPDGTVSLAWTPDDARSTIVSRDVLEGITDEHNRLTRENRERVVHAGSLQRQIEDLTRERDDERSAANALSADVTRIHGWLTEALDALERTDRDLCEHEPDRQRDPRVAELRRLAGIA